LTGIAGTHFQGVTVTEKNGSTPSPSLVPGAYTFTVICLGGEAPIGVTGCEKEKRAKCLGMFQFKRPL